MKLPPIFTTKSNEVSISDRTGEDKTQFTSDFKNKELFLWLTKSGNTAKFKSRIYNEFPWLWLYRIIPYNHSSKEMGLIYTK